MCFSKDIFLLSFLQVGRRGPVGSLLARLGFPCIWSLCVNSCENAAIFLSSQGFWLLASQVLSQNIWRNICS